MVFGLTQEEHPEKSGLFAEHRQAPLLLKTPVLLQTRSVDLGAPQAHDHCPCSAFAITGRPALSRSGPSFCLFTAPRATAPLFSPSKCSLSTILPPATSTGESLLDIHRRCTGRPIGVTSTKRWVGGWRSIRWRGSPTPCRAS